MEKVIFRKFKDDGEIIALFPNINEGRGFVQSYMQTGQHSPADYNHVINITNPAREKEYETLLNELRAIGYDNLAIRQRRGA